MATRSRSTRAGAKFKVVTATRLPKRQRTLLNRYAIPVGLRRAGGRSVRVGELKNIDNGYTGCVSPSTTGAFGAFLNGVMMGSAGFNRIGRFILMKYMEVVLSLGAAGATTGVSPVRVIVVYDRQCNKTSPAILDIMNSDNIYSHFNINNKRRFKIVLDKTVNSVSNNGQAVCKKFRIPLNLPVEFGTGNTGAVSDIVTGSLFVFIWQNGQLATSLPVCDIETRIWFSDN